MSSSSVATANDLGLFYPANPRVPTNWGQATDLGLIRTVDARKSYTQFGEVSDLGVFQPPVSRRRHPGSRLVCVQQSPCAAEHNSFFGAEEGRECCNQGFAEPAREVPIIQQQQQCGTLGRSRPPLLFGGTFSQ